MKSDNDDEDEHLKIDAIHKMIDSEKNDELTSAGLDPNDLEEMGYFERRQALEDAGLDPDDYE